MSGDPAEPHECEPEQWIEKLERELITEREENARLSEQVFVLEEDLKAALRERNAAEDYSASLRERVAELEAAKGPDAHKAWREARAAEKEVGRLRAAIEAAPHHEFCPQRWHTEPGHCDCWKREALRQDDSLSDAEGGEGGE